MALRRLAIGVAVAALGVAGCGGSKQPAPVQEVPQAPVTSSAAPPAAAQVGTTATDSVTNLGARYTRIFAQLIDARDVLDNRAGALTAAASDAEALATRIAQGYNAPPGSVPQVTRLRDALGSFGEVLDAVMSSETQLPRLSVELQVRYAQLAKRRPHTAAALLTAKQRVDTAMAEIANVGRNIAAAELKVTQQSSEVTLDANALAVAAASGTHSSALAVAQVDAAVDTGFQALVAPS